MTDKQHDNFQYAGFWVRFVAYIIDNILLFLLGSLFFLIFYWYHEPLDHLDSGAPVLIPLELVWLVFSSALIIALWIYKCATPGKMLFGARIVDADTGGPASAGKYIARYLSYIISFVFLGLGFLWIAFDKRKQGWHDKLAGTVVIKPIDLTATVADPVTRVRFNERDGQT